MRFGIYSEGTFVKSRSAQTRLALLVLAACVQIAGAGVARAGAPSNAAATDLPFAIADFDGDRSPDLAIVQSANSRNAVTKYWIRFELSSGTRQFIGITAPAGGLQLASRDVNGDNFADVVVSTTLLHRPVAVLLNDGHGKFALEDAGEFPEAFWTAKLSWMASVLQVLDGALNLPPTSSSGDPDESVPASSPEEGRAAVGFVICRATALSLAIAVPGRSPPPLVHQV
jgi:VCBS repeat protein